MAHRSQSSSQGENPLDPSYLEPHYKEYYRLAIDVLAADGEDSYYKFLANDGAIDFLCSREIEHIRKYLQRPQNPGNESAYTEPMLYADDGDGSSGTYWPLHSDIAAPELDLGWPMIRGLQRTTEVTTLVHPPPAETPSIKEELRKMIKEARQVIGVVMDIFTDIDLFSDLLDAASRRVPVYILLDEFHSHFFMEMVSKCKVNLGFVEFMRVRTVPGTTYFCRTGTSFRGHMLEKFMLVDCRVVLSGTYSFMWSFEKIHRSIAHIFHGELVGTFDEEFRILFAQSNPIIPVENALVKADNMYGMPQFGLNRKPLHRQQMMFLRDDPARLSQHSKYSFADHIDPDRGLQAFRRDDAFRHTLEVPTGRMLSQKYGLPMELDKMQFNPSQALLQAKKLEMEAYKRHSFAEGTFENYASSRQFMQQRVINNMEEYEFQASHFQREHHIQLEHPFNLSRQARGQGLFEKIKGGKFGLLNTDVFGDDSRYPLDIPALESEFPPGNFRPMLDYGTTVSSDSSKEVRHGSGLGNPADEGRFGQRSQRRQNMGQTYICQTSPTQKQNLEQRLLFQEPKQDKKPQENRQGLRSWRISSYLSSYQDEANEGIPGPLGSESADDVLMSQEPARPSLESSPRFTRDLPQTSVVNLIEAHRIKALDMDRTKELVSSAEKEAEESKEVTLIKHDSLRSRLNPMLQRSSRLRSSLIFSSSKLEQHTSTQQDKSSLLNKDQATTEGENEGESIKTASSTLTEILERHKSLNRGSYFNKRASDLTSKQEMSKNTEKLTKENADSKPSFLKDFPKSSISQQVPGNSNTTSEVKSRIQEFEKRDASKSAITEKTEKTSTESKAFDFKVSKNLPKQEINKSADKPEKKEVLPPAPPEKSTKPIPPSAGAATQAVTTSEATAKQNQASVDTRYPRSRPASTSILDKATEGLSKTFGSTTSLNILEEGNNKKDISALELLRRGSAKFRQLNIQKEDKKQEEPALAVANSQSESLNAKQPGDSQGATRGVRRGSQDVVTANTEEKEEKVVKTAPPAKSSQPSQSRFASSTTNMLYSTNLRDDTKVILEQISANSQKNRVETSKQSQQAPVNEADDSKQSAISAASKDSEASDASDSEKQPRSISRYESLMGRSRYNKLQGTPEDRDDLIKKMDNIRKEKRVYSRFEVFYKNKDEEKDTGKDEDSQSDKASKEKKSGKLVPRLFGNLIGKK